MKHLFNGEQIEVTTINNDLNGNPRHVIGYRIVARLVEELRNDGDNVGYEETLYLLKKSGFGKFHNRQFGGGLKFQSYNIDKDLTFLAGFVRDVVAKIAAKQVKGA